MDKKISSVPELIAENAATKRGRKIAIIVLICAALLCLAIAKCAGRF